MGQAWCAAAHRKMGGGGNWKAKQLLIQAAAAILAAGLAAVLFYNSPWGLFWLPVTYLLASAYLGDRRKKQRLARLNLEFKDYLYAVNALLLAGYSAERAFLGGLSDIRQLYGENGILAVQLCTMEARLKVQEPMEQILKDFARDSGSEDVRSFVEIFCYAKRGGGDFAHIISTSVGRICDKMEVLEEIRTVMAEKALEQKVMCTVPLGILLFFRVTSPEFIGRLYGNLFGVLVMTAALVLYGAAFFLGIKLTEIEV